MNKIKLFIASMLGAIALVFACVLGTRVNATSYEIGTAVISPANTKTWDFKVADAKTLADGDDVNGVIVYGGWNVNSKSGKTKVAAPSIKSDNGGLDFYWKGYILVPVVSASSTGKVNISLTSNNNQRYLQLIDKTSSVSSYAITAPTMSFDFDADDVWTINEKYYVKVMSALVSTKSDYSTLVTCEEGQETTVTCGSSGEIKMGSVQIVLDSESYGASATLYTVTYMDGTANLKTDDKAVKDSSITYVPKKYGYDFEGWYTASNLASESKINTTTYTVTSDATLYANWTEWADNKIGVNTLTNEAIEKIGTGVDGNLTADLVLAPSIYTAMTGSSVVSTNVTLPDASEAKQAACINTVGSVSTSKNSLKFTAPADGTFVAYVGCGGTSSRNLVFSTDGATAINPAEGASTLAFDGKSYEPRTFTFGVTKGTTYYLGGTNGVRIYYASFEATDDIADVATLSFDAQYDKADATAATKLRFIGTIEGLAASNYANIYSITFTFDFNGTTDRKCAVTQLYLSITTDDNKYEAADNKMYFVYQLDGIRNYTDNQKLTNCKLTVVFTDGSSKTETHADIELPTFA